MFWDEIREGVDVHRPGGIAVRTVRTYQRCGWTYCVHPQALIVQNWPMASLSGFLDHTHTDTRWDSSGRVISPSQRPLPAQGNTTYRHKTNIHAPSGDRTRDPRNQAAADLRLRPRGHWDRHILYPQLQKTEQYVSPKHWYCEILGFHSTVTVEWCVIVVFPHWCNNENKCLLTIKTKR
jgi:hypothetical protein